MNYVVMEEVSSKVSWNMCYLLLEFSRVNMGIHTALKILRNKVDLQHLCGYVTMLNPSSRHANRKLSDASDGRGWLPIIVVLLCSLNFTYNHLNKLNKRLNSLIWNSTKYCPPQVESHFECEFNGSSLTS